MSIFIEALEMSMSKEINVEFFDIRAHIIDMTPSQTNLEIYVLAMIEKGLRERVSISITPILRRCLGREVGQ